MLSQHDMATETAVLAMPSEREGSVISDYSPSTQQDGSRESTDTLSYQTKKRPRGVTLTDIWAAAREVKDGEGVRDEHGHRWFYCSLCEWKGAASNRIRTHLRSHNLRIDDAQPAAKRQTIAKSIAGLPGFFDRQKAIKQGRDLAEEKCLRSAINKPAFLEALVQLISRHSLPLSIVEFPEFYALLSSIDYVAADVIQTSRNKVPDLLVSSFTIHKEQVKKRLQEALSWVHFSVDMWSAPSKTGVLGVVAHFIDKTSRKVEKALLALRELPGRHCGEAQAEHVVQVISEYDLQDRVGFFTLDNHGANDTML